MDAQIRWRWSGVEQEAARRWVAWETPLEIGEEAPLEVVVGAPLELAGEREWTVWARARKDFSSYGRGCGVG